jgi:hypothetical protein
MKDRKKERESCEFMRFDNEDAWVSAYIYSWLYLTFARDLLFGFVLDEIFSKLSWRNVGTTIFYLYVFG